MVEAVVRLASWMPFGRAVRGGLVYRGHDERNERAAADRSGRAGLRGGANGAGDGAGARDADAPQGPLVQALFVDGAMVPLVGGSGARSRPWRSARWNCGSRESTTAGGADHRPLLFLPDDGPREVYPPGPGGDPRRGTETAGVVCAVSDGAVWIQACLDHHRPDAVRILDWPHAVEYLSVVAKAVFGLETPAATVWLAQQKETLLHGDPAGVPDSLADLLAAVTAVAEGHQERLVWTVAATPPLQGVLGRAAARQAVPVVAEISSICANGGRNPYAAFRAAHYPIGSGSVESANKLLVEARLKGAGMHWAPASVNPMVALRTVAYGDRWPAAWPLIRTTQRRERQAASRQRRTIRRRARPPRRQAGHAGAGVRGRPRRPPSPPPPPLHHGGTSAPPLPHPCTQPSLAHRTLSHRRSA